MAQILGIGYQEFLLEDDGTLWSRDKNVQYDPVTYEPLLEMPTPEVNIPIEPIPDEQDVNKCSHCGKKFKNKRARNMHELGAHRRVK